MKHNRKKYILMIAGLFVVLTVVLYSCGGGYGGGTTPATATVQVVACPVSGTTDISIVSVAAGYSPGSAPVPVNTTVKWTNNDSVQHTVTSTSVPLYGTFNETVNAGASVCLKFTSAGAFNYHCSLHPAMPAGLVTVS